jgi:hypothetical protein
MKLQFIILSALLSFSAMGKDIDVSKFPGKYKLVKDYRKKDAQCPSRVTITKSVHGKYIEIESDNSNVINESFSYEKSKDCDDRDEYLQKNCRYASSTELKYESDLGIIFRFPNYIKLSNNGSTMIYQSSDSSELKCKYEKVQ